MHDTWLREQNIHASYIPINVTEGMLEQAVNSLKLLGCSGWNVTVPYKEAIIPFLDRIDESAVQIGAVNTVVKTDGGEFVGYNTDGLGFIRSLGETDTSNRILVLGAGGAARGIVFAFKQLGYQNLSVANRSYENAKKLVNELQIGQAITFSEAEEQLQTFDVVIQTTPLGMKNNTKELPIKLEGIKEYTIVADIVYNPLVTPFLEEATKKNVRTINGLGMLVHQGALAFSYWNGIYPNTDDMIQRLTEQLGG